MERTAKALHDKKSTKDLILLFSFPFENKLLHQGAYDATENYLRKSKTIAHQNKKKKKGCSKILL
jgi:hypothetical protein